MALMKQSQNEAVIEGKLYEKIVRDFPDGAIAGEFVIQVEDISLDGETFTSLVPVSFYAKPLTLQNKTNPAYAGIKTIVDKAKSVMESEDPATANPDYIRLRSGTIGENMFYARDGRFVTFTRVRGSFFDRVNASDCVPKAQFKVKMIISNILPEEKMVDSVPTETGRLIVTGQIVQYKGVLDEIKFFVSNKKNIDHVNKNWSVGDTVNAQGIMKYVTVDVADDSATDDDFFGEPVVNTVTRRVRELILTGGSGGPVDGEDEDDIAEARRARKMRIGELKEKSAEQATDTPPAAKKNANPKAQADW